MPLNRSDHYHDLDLHANQLLNSRVHNITTANRTTLGATLGLSDKGYQVYDTDLSTPYFWDGTAWQSAGGGGSYVPLSRNLTINGTTYDLSADRTWTINSLPSQATHAGQWLTTDGTNASWASLPSPTIPDLQQVLTQGRTENNGIWNITLNDYYNLGDDNYVFKSYNIDKPEIQAVLSLGLNSSNNYLTFGDPTLQYTDIGLVDIRPSGITLFRALSSYKHIIEVPLNYNGDFTNTLPKANGVFALSINSTYTTDEFGNINIPIGTGTVTQIDTSGPITGGPINNTGTIGITQATTSTDGYLSFTDWNNFNGKQDAITLTTTGTSGAATFISNTLNIPQYQAVLTNPITGIGVATQVAFWDTTSSISSDTDLYWDNTNKRLGVGTNLPTKMLDVESDSLINGLTVGKGSYTSLLTEWSSTNLDVTTYRNGDPIPQITDPTDWLNTTTGAWCYPNNDPALGAIYGKLYNWYAVSDPRGLAPAGWRIPTDTEWSDLILSFGGLTTAGGALKEAGTTHWASPNTGATNSSGFTALPGGRRTFAGIFNLPGNNGSWWTSTIATSGYAYVYGFSYNSTNVLYGYDYFGTGYSVRLIRNYNANTTVGEKALFNNTSGSNSTAIGYNSLLSQTTGSYNTVLGKIAGATITTGSNNTIIGANVDVPSSSSSNYVLIGDGQGNVRFKDDGTNTILPRLAGGSVRMVTAGTNGELSTQTISSGTVISVGVTNGTGISASVANPSTTPNITITNTAPDQTVVLSNGTGISTSGTYPNFTITNSAPDQTVVLNAGTGIGVTGTYPNFTITNSNPFTSPLIAKGDIYVRNGSGDTRLGVGIDTQVLIADSSTATGLKWGSNTAPTPTGYYGQFFDYNIQTATTNNIGVAMIFGTLDVANGISVVSDGTNLTKITFANTGIYNLQFSAQVQNTSNSPQDIYVWLRKNGTTAAADVAGSTGVVGMEARKTPTDPSHTIVTWNYILDVVGGDYYQLVWATTDVTNVTIHYYASTANHPSTASTLFTVTQQSGIMAGTGITAINSLTGAVQTLGTGTSGTDFDIVSSGTSHTFNLPDASATARGVITTGAQTIAGAKSFSSNIKIPSVGSQLILQVASDGTVSGMSTATYPSPTELSYVKGVTSAIQTQLGNKQASSTSLTSLSGLTYASTSFVKMTGANTFALDTNTYLTSVGTGTTNEITYWSGANTLGSLTTATYPSLTELSYVKGVTSGIQTQLGNKQGTITFTTNNTSGAATFTSNTLNIPNYSNNDALVAQAYGLLGSTIKGINLCLPNYAMMTGTTAALASGTVRFIAYYLPNAQTITGVKWWSSANASYTANNYNGVGLYSYSGGTLTLIASSTNDGTIWSGAASNSMGSKAFSQQIALSAGVYYIGLLYSSSAQTTAPSLGSAGVMTQTNMGSADFTNSARLLGSLISQTALPNTQALSGTSSGTATLGVWLY